MKLHYSQTLTSGFTFRLVFYYLMKLHYSQTTLERLRVVVMFYYLMKLHYSQTTCKVNATNISFTTL